MRSCAVIADVITVATTPRIRRLTSRQPVCFSALCFSLILKRGGRTKPVTDTQKHPTNEIMKTNPGTNTARSVHMAQRRVLTTIRLLKQLLSMFSFPSIISPHWVKKEHTVRKCETKVKNDKHV